MKHECFWASEAHNRITGNEDNYRSLRIFPGGLCDSSNEDYSRKPKSYNASHSLSKFFPFMKNMRKRLSSNRSKFSTELHFWQSIVFDATISTMLSETIRKITDTLCIHWNIIAEGKHGKNFAIAKLEMFWKVRDTFQFIYYLNLYCLVGRTEGGSEATVCGFELGYRLHFFHFKWPRMYDKRVQKSQVAGTHPSIGYIFNILYDSVGVRKGFRSQKSKVRTQN